MSPHTSLGALRIRESDKPRRGSWIPSLPGLRKGVHFATPTSKAHVHPFPTLPYPMLGALRTDCPGPSLSVVRVQPTPCALPGVRTYSRGGFFLILNIDLGGADLRNVAFVFRTATVARARARERLRVV